MRVYSIFRAVKKSHIFQVVRIDEFSLQFSEQYFYDRLLPIQQT